MSVCENNDESDYSYAASSKTKDDDDDDESFEAIDAPEDDDEALKSNPESNKVVEIVLPKELLLKAPPKEQQQEPVLKDESASSLASSFVPVQRMNALGLKAGDEVASLASSFVPVQRMGALGLQTTTREISTASSYTFQNDTTYPPSSTGSLVSTFDCLDVDGCAMRRCRRDGYLNEPDATTCGACGAALVANPSVDMDLQIAMNLQQKEEQEAFAALQQSENKRKHLAEEPQLRQAQVFSDEIASFLIQRGGLRQGYRALHSDVERAVLARRFLECARERLDSAMAPLQLGYCFFSKLQTARCMRKIVRQDGAFRIWYMDDPIQAFEHWQDHMVQLELSALPRIQEEEESNKSSNHNNNHTHQEGPGPLAAGVGWIVATAPGSNPAGHFVATPERKKSPKEVYRVTHLYDAQKSCLPLICFEAPQRYHSETKALRDGLERVCRDFFASAGLLVDDMAAATGTTTTTTTEASSVAATAGDWGTDDGVAHEAKKSRTAADDEDEGILDITTCAVCGRTILTELPCPDGCNPEERRPLAPESGVHAPSDQAQVPFPSEDLPLPPEWTEHWDKVLAKPFWSRKHDNLATYDRAVLMELCGVQTSLSARRMQRDDEENEGAAGQSAAGWSVFKDATSGECFWFNEEQSKVVWERSLTE